MRTMLNLTIFQIKHKLSENIKKAMDHVHIYNMPICRYADILHIQKYKKKRTQHGSMCIQKCMGK